MLNTLSFELKATSWPASFARNNFHGCQTRDAISGKTMPANPGFGRSSATCAPVTSASPSSDTCASTCWRDTEWLRLCFPIPKTLTCNVINIIPDDSSSHRKLGLVRLADGKIRCLSCCKDYSNPGNANRHYREVHQAADNLKTYFCQVCNAGYSMKRYCDSHMLTKHGISQKMLKQQFVPDEYLK